MTSLFQARASPLTLRLLALSAVVGFAPGLNNVSLKYNGLGFYQVVKLLVTPLIAGAEYACYGHTLSVARALALTAVCVGVGVAVVNDVTINAAGAAASAAWLPVAAAYKVRGRCVVRLLSGWWLLHLLWLHLLLPPFHAFFPTFANSTRPCCRAP